MPPPTAPSADPPSEETSPAPAAGSAAKTEGSNEAKNLTIPTGKGLPVLVHPAFFFLDLKRFDDTAGEFEAVIDMRLRWSDTRLRFEKNEAPRGYKEYRGEAAEEFLKTIWTPHVELTNRTEIAPYVGRRVRVSPDGDVEVLERTTSKYKVPVDAQRFPFDRQFLKLDLIVRDETTDEVLLEFLKDDVVFSRIARGLALEGWTPGLINLSRDQVPGWNGDRYSRASASLFVDRVATAGITPIFIPLIASLLIPLLALWMNKPKEEGFEVDAFELANVSIGGLFSVIALSFAIYTSYGVIAGSDNTVTRLFGLNYVTLAISLAVVIMFYRFNWPARLFGPYVQEQAFKFLLWAMPVLVIGTSIALLLVAAA
jgi:hypothetical protein